MLEELESFATENSELQMNRNKNEIRYSLKRTFHHFFLLQKSGLSCVNRNARSIVSRPNLVTRRVDGLQYEILISSMIGLWLVQIEKRNHLPHKVAEYSPSEVNGIDLMLYQSAFIRNLFSSPVTLHSFGSRSKPLVGIFI
jgi:hypothetical protein